MNSCIAWLVIVLLVLIFVFKEEVMQMFRKALGTLFVSQFVSGGGDLNRGQRDMRGKSGFLSTPGMPDKAHPESVMMIDNFDNGPDNRDQYSSDLSQLVVSDAERESHNESASRRQFVSTGASKVVVRDDRNDDNNWVFSGSTRMPNYNVIDANARTVPSKTGPEEAARYRGIVV